MATLKTLARWIGLAFLPIVTYLANSVFSSLLGGLLLVMMAGPLRSLLGLDPLWQIVIVTVGIVLLLMLGAGLLLRSVQERKSRTLSPSPMDSAPIMAASNEPTPALQGRINWIVSGSTPGAGTFVLMIVTVTNSGPESSVGEYCAHATLASEVLDLHPKVILDGFTLKNPDMTPFARWDTTDSLPEKTARPIPSRGTVAGPLRFTVIGKTPKELTDSRWTLEFEDAKGTRYETPEIILRDQPGELPYIPGSGTTFIPSGGAQVGDRDQDAFLELLDRAGTIVEGISSLQSLPQVETAAACGLPSLRTDVGRFLRYQGISTAIYDLHHWLGIVLDQRRNNEDTRESVTKVRRFYQQLASECDRITRREGYQPPNLVGEILCPVGFSFGGADFLAIELAISNDGTPTTVHGLRAMLSSNDGTKKISGNSFRVDASFAVNHLPEEFGRRREYLISSWLEKTVGERPIVPHTTSLPGFFVAKLDTNLLVGLEYGLQSCHLEVDFCDANGHRCPPALYSKTDKDGALWVGFGVFEVLR